MEIIESLPILESLPIIVAIIWATASTIKITAMLIKLIVQKIKGKDTEEQLAKILKRIDKLKEQANNLVVKNTIKKE